jgi:CPA2 family monovalent cation:H+ antiporter-2
LNFHVSELLAVRRFALPGAIVGFAIATALGFVVACVAGWGTPAAVLFGLTICATSTVVLLRVLADRDEVQTPVGHLAIGWLVVEDLLAILALVMIPVFAAPSKGGSASLVFSAIVALLKIAALVAFVLVAGKRFFPWLLAIVAKTRSRELFTLTVLVVPLGVAVGSAELFGASMALGAFLGGMVVGQSAFGARAASEALPMRDAFAVLFFVSVGMLFDPGELVPNLPMTVATLAVVLFGKPLAAFVIVRLLGAPNAVAIPLAASLAQIGEFSFLVAAVGRSLQILPDRATQILVTVSIITITLNPILQSAAQRTRRTSCSLGSNAPAEDTLGPCSALSGWVARRRSPLRRPKPSLWRETGT